MRDDLGPVVFSLAGRPVPDPWDRIRRYCGLSWSGGPSETWAFRFYDLVESSRDRVEPVDVLAAASLHPGLSRADLSFFWDQADALSTWVTQLPIDIGLRDADDDLIGELTRLVDWRDSPGLALLTKVLHRKRPSLIPLVDRALLDWYRPVTGERTATAAWPALLQALRGDLSVNEVELGRMAEALQAEIAAVVSALRLVDIAIWMGGSQ